MAGAAKVAIRSALSGVGVGVGGPLATQPNFVSSRAIHRTRATLAHCIGVAHRESPLNAKFFHSSASFSLSSSSSSSGSASSVVEEDTEDTAAAAAAAAAPTPTASPSVPRTSSPVSAASSSSSEAKVVAVASDSDDRSKAPAMDAKVNRDKPLASSATSSPSSSSSLSSSSSSASSPPPPPPPARDEAKVTARASRNSKKQHETVTDDGKAKGKTKTKAKAKATRDESSSSHHTAGSKGEERRGSNSSSSSSDEKSGSTGGSGSSSSPPSRLALGGTCVVLARRRLLATAALYLSPLLSGTAVSPAAGLVSASSSSATCHRVSSMSGMGGAAAAAAAAFATVTAAAAAAAAAAEAEASPPRYRIAAGVRELPHPEKAKKGGEDASLVIEQAGVLAVFDGVGGWAEQGIDPRDYSVGLMTQVDAAVRKAMSENREVKPLEVLQSGYDQVSRKGIIGSTTACVVVVREHEGKLILETANLGDSGYRIYRPSSMKFPRPEFAAPAQQHSFNFPFQLGAESGDKPRQSMQNTHEVLPDDIIVLGTDGLFDNVFDKDIGRMLAAAVREANPDSSSRHSGVDVVACALEIARNAQRIGESRTGVTPFADEARRNNIRWQGGKLDDVTVIVAQVQRPSPPTTFNAATMFDATFRDAGVPFTVATPTATATTTTTTAAAAAAPPVAAAPPPPPPPPAVPPPATPPTTTP